MTYKDLLVALSGITPKQAYKKLEKNPNDQNKFIYEQIIIKDPKHAYWYARNILKNKWKEAEEYIKNHPYWAYRYAKDVINGRFLEAEPSIRKSPRDAYNYAYFIIDDDNFWKIN